VNSSQRRLTPRRQLPLGAVEGLSKYRVKYWPGRSAELRDRLISELDCLQSEDDAAGRVHRRLPDKNTLATTDAQFVEVHFQAKLATFVEQPFPDAPKEEMPVSPAAEVSDAAPSDLFARATVETAVENESHRRRPTAKTIRLRDKEHCKFVARQPCVVCGRTPGEAHHLRFAQPRALGRKVSDEYTVPVCRLHHRELHTYGDEVSWWAGVNVDPVPIALGLWRRSHEHGFNGPNGGCHPLDSGSAEEPIGERKLQGV
jgi:hypothetical protein